jgi:lipopolysaccharide/colanic/teichoic acid biosynthesis glycosyltransferase
MRGPVKPWHRLFDVLAALLGICVLLPLLFAVAMAVWIDDGRPFLFVQKRLGKDGRLFSIWKFRTMRVLNAGRHVTAAGDERVTRVGSVLRKFKLDELPQLFNVLKGDMSLIGPRPELAEFVNEDHRWNLVLSVRPGITDLASLVFRNEEQLLSAASNPEDYYRRYLLPAKLALNVRYIQTRSLRRDLKLLLLSVWYSVRPRSFNPRQVEKTFEG